MYAVRFWLILRVSEFMLRNLRAFASSAVGAIFILLLALPFVANTGQGPQTSTAQGSSAVSVAGERFYDLDVQRAANVTFLQAADLVTGNPRTLDEARALDGWSRVENLVISQLVLEPVIFSELATQQWTASEEEIIANMVNDPQFQVAGQYVKLLAEQALDTPEKEAYYIAQKRQEINTQRLQELASLYAPTYTPTVVVDAAYNLQNRLYGFDIFELSATDEAIGTPTDRQLDEIFDTNPDAYKTQERRGLSAIAIAPDLFDGEDAVDQAKQAIEALQDTQQDGITPEGSLDIIDATLEDLASTIGIEITTFPEVDRFGRNAEDMRNESAVNTEGLLRDGFSLSAVGDLSEVRVIGDGIAIVVRLDSLTEARPQTRQEATDALARAWTYETQTTALRTRIDGSLAEIDTGLVSFGELANREGAAVVTAELVSAIELPVQGINPMDAAKMTVGDISVSHLGVRTLVYQLRELGQQSEEAASVGYADIEASATALYSQKLSSGFLQELEANADIKRNDREFNQSMDAAILTANNAGYFDGTATESSVRNVLSSLQVPGFSDGL